MFTALIKSILDRWDLERHKTFLPHSTYLIYKSSFAGFLGRCNNPDADQAELEKCLEGLRSLLNTVHAAHKTKKKTKSEDRPTRRTRSKSPETKRPTAMEL